MNFVKVLSSKTSVLLLLLVVVVVVVVVQDIKTKLLGIISVDLDATGRILIIYSAFVKCLRKN